MATMKEATAEFLCHKRVAVTGVSRTPGSHGSNAVYKRLRERGYDVFAVNPNADKVEGDRAYHDLGSIPGGVEAVVIGTQPDHADADDARVCRAESSTSGCTAVPAPAASQRLRPRTAATTAST